MTQETAGPVTARRKNLSRCVTYLKPELRFILDKVGNDEDDDCRAETIRELVLAALMHMGYGEHEIRAMYLRFALDCAERGEDNPYELSR